MKSTMMVAELSINDIFARAARLFPQSEVVSLLPDKSLRRQDYAQITVRARALAHALRALGVDKGDRVATLCWNHHAHLECYFGIPLTGAVMHTLNLRLSPAEIGWIAGHAQDKVLVVDNVLLPLYRQVSQHHGVRHLIDIPFGEAQLGEAQHGENVLD